MIRAYQVAINKWLVIEERDTELRRKIVTSYQSAMKLKEDWEGGDYSIQGVVSQHPKLGRIEYRNQGIV